MVPVVKNSLLTRLEAMYFAFQLKIEMLKWWGFDILILSLYVLSHIVTEHSCQRRALKKFQDTKESPGNLKGREKVENKPEKK